MTDSQTPPLQDSDLIAGVRALEHSPLGALLFRTDDPLTLLWRNAAHARMSDSEGRDVTGQGIFEAFPPGKSDKRSDPRAPILNSVATVVRTGNPDTIGPFRFDLHDGTRYREHHWTTQHSPVFDGDRVIAILQIGTDVTAQVLDARLAKSRLRTAERVAAVSVFLYDPETDLFERGRDIDAMFGIENAGPHAAPFFERIVPEDLPRVDEEVARIFAAPRGEMASFDYRVNRPDGTLAYVRIRAEVATDPNDRREKLTGTFVDVTDIETARRALEDIADTREALLQESNHRIKNSLSMAISMLRTEARSLMRKDAPSPDDVQAALQGVERRIQAVADVHGLLYLDGADTDVRLDHLLRRFVQLVQDSTGLGNRALQLNADVGDATLAEDRTVSLGLIVNELLTNAVKYGVSVDQSQGASITARIGTDGWLDLRVENSKVGESDRFAVVESTGLGSRLVDGFVRRLKGQLDYRDTEDGFEAVLKLPLND